MKSKISSKQEIDAATFGKAVAIIAVVLLHSLALFPETIYTSGNYQDFVIFINQLSRFSVPLFIALSGYGLAKKYQRQVLKKGKFLTDRVRKLLPQYLLWSLILFFSIYLSGSWSSGEEIGLVEGLIYGKVDYHLYFVPLIFQFYLMFSLILTRMNSRRVMLVLVGLSGLLQVGWFALIRYFAEADLPSTSVWVNDQAQYRLVLSWLFYFLAGIGLAKIDLEKLRGSLGVLIGTLAAAAVGLGWSIHDSLQLLKLNENVIYATSFVRLPVLLYATSVILLMIVYGPMLVGAGAGRHNIAGNLLNRGLKIIGKYSYIIYLSHTLVLRIVEGLLTEGPGAVTMARASALLVIGMMVSVMESR